MSIELCWLEERLNGAGAPLIIDGGMGTELEKSGVPMDGKVWSGAAVLSHPEVVRGTHEDCIAAGAEVINANTFAAARHMLEPQARDNAATNAVAIAGSICEWAPADDPRWNTPESVGRSVREQAEILAQAGVDFFALEMCELVDFSEAAIDAALEFDLPVWLGLSARSFPGCESLSVFDDESLVQRLARYPAMMMNVMHTPVTDIEEALGIVRRYWQGPVGVYPESGYFTMPNWQFVDVIEPAQLVEMARHWVAGGVRMVGGCCGLGPAHIAALHEAFNPGVSGPRATASTGLK
jgi:homocysteine S-methyltransferase